MSSPIENRIGQVFVPVTDMDRAIAWYSRLLGVPIAAATHGGTIYNVPMQGETQLALDGTRRQVSNSSQPLFFFWTRDIQAAYAFLQENNVAIVGAVEDIGSVLFVIFKDPDGNLLMVCQPNR